MVKSSNKLFSSDSWKNWVFFRIPPRTLLWAQVPFSEDFEPSIFHVKNWSFAHQLDGHTTKHHCTWKLVLMALVTLFKISSWLLPGSCPAPVLPNQKKLCLSFCSSSQPLAWSSTIWLLKCPLTMLFHDNFPSQELPSAWYWEWWTFPRTHLIEITIRNFENLSIYPDICIRQHEEWNFDRSKSSRDDNLAWCTIFENRTGRRPWVKDKQETKNSPHTTFENEKMILEIGMGSKSSQSGKNINFIAGITVDLHERHPPALCENWRQETPKRPQKLRIDFGKSFLWVPYVLQQHTIVQIARLPLYRPIVTTHVQIVN